MAHKNIYKNRRKGGIADVSGSILDIFQDETLESNAQKMLLSLTTGLCLLDIDCTLKYPTLWKRSIEDRESNTNTC